MVKALGFSTKYKLLEQIMKKLLLSLALFVAVPAMAQHHGHRHFHHYYKHHGHGNHWIAPLIVGGVVTYALTRPQTQPVIVEQPVYVQREPVCTPWKEVQQADGSVVRERTCTQ